MVSVRYIVLLGLVLAIPGCGARTNASISSSAETDFSAPTTGATHPAPNQIPVIAGDYISKPYRSLGDISVTISKWTIFDADPTPADINAELREKAAAVGADAVVLARYGTIGIGALTYGKLEGRGRAIVFAN